LKVIDKNGTLLGDIRGVLKGTREALRQEGHLNAANEIEGFLFRAGRGRHYHNGKFNTSSTGGYYHSLPGDLRSSTTRRKCSAPWVPE
jgi:glutamine synthetase